MNQVESHEINKLLDDLRGMIERIGEILDKLRAAAGQAAADAYRPVRSLPDKMKMEQAFPIGCSVIAIRAGVVVCKGTVEEHRIPEEQILVRARAGVSIWVRPSGPGLLVSKLAE